MASIGIGFGIENPRFPSIGIGIGIDFGPVRGIGIGLAKLVLSVSDVYGKRSSPDFELHLRADYFAQWLYHALELIKTMHFESETGCN